MTYYVLTTVAVLTYRVHTLPGTIPKSTYWYVDTS